MSGTEFLGIQMQSSASQELRSADAPIIPRIGDAPACTNCIWLLALERQIAVLMASLPSTPTRPIKLVPVDRVGEILGLQKSAVQELTARGLLRRVKLGNSTSRRAAARWVEDEIFAYAWALVSQIPTPSAPVIDADSDNKKVAPRKAVQKRAPRSPQINSGKRAAR